MYRYFYFNIDEIEPYIEDMVKRIRLLVENYGSVLEGCVSEIADEREMKASKERLPSIQEGYGNLVKLLIQLCKKKGVKCILYVNYKPLPVAAAVKKLYIY